MMESCYGCDGPLTKPSTFVAIVNAGTKESPTWEQAPVCDLCHRDPAHRTRVIKGTFFPRGPRADVAQTMAGSSTITPY